MTSGPDKDAAISFDLEQVDLAAVQSCRCISVLASLNKHWYELCTSMLWEARWRFLPDRESRFHN